VQGVAAPATHAARPTMTENTTERPLTTGEWVITHLILFIPIVNIIMHFVWAFGDGNISRRNFCRARLLIFAVILGLAMLLGAAALIFTGLFAGVLSHIR
jgi:chromate transport protein ChrA